MSGHSTYQPQSPFMKWFERRLPIVSLVYSSFIAYPTPRNLNYWWTFGGILAFMLGVQIVTGIVLAMHYTPHVDFAFDSVESIMRDVNYGWLLRYLHANGASFFFVAVYTHIARGMYYGSYKEPREVLWILGVILFLLMVATGFMGYVLPWGQMSFWAATVITNLFSALPGVGEPIVTWLWGGFAVGNPTLNRFYSLHYLLPFVIAGVVVLHIWALQWSGRTIRPASSRRPRRTPWRSRPMRPPRMRSSSACSACSSPGSCFTSRTSRPLRQLHPGQSGPDADPYRAGMVLPAVLRDPARDPEQAPRRHRAGRLDHHSRLPAVARYVAGAFGELPAAVPAIPADLLRRRDRARLSRLARADGRLCDRGAHPDALLFRLLPHHPAAARIVRKNQAAAELDFGSGAA